MFDLDEKFVSLCFDAVRSPDRWERVLTYMMMVTGSPAAMITLRENSTCQIVIDKALIERFHSPLICGFPPPVVEYYLLELRTIDPWAEAQIANRPHRPVLMSNVCDPDTVSDRRFFIWLESLGIADTVACEIGNFPGYWTACNIFVPADRSDIGGDALSFLSTHQSILKSAWRASQDSIQSEQSGYAVLAELSNLELPACIMSDRGSLLLSNDAFEKLLTSGAAKVSGAERILKVADTANVVGNADDLPKGLFSLPVDNLGDLIVSARSFDLDPLYPDRRKRSWLLTFRTKTALGNPIYLRHDLSKLSHRQKKC